MQLLRRLKEIFTQEETKCSYCGKKLFGDEKYTHICEEKSLYLRKELKSLLRWED